MKTASQYKALTSPIIPDLRDVSISCIGQSIAAMHMQCIWESASYSASPYAQGRQAAIDAPDEIALREPVRTGDPGKLPVCKKRRENVLLSPDAFHILMVLTFHAVFRLLTDSSQIRRLIATIALLSARLS